MHPRGAGTNCQLLSFHFERCRKGFKKPTGPVRIDFMNPTDIKAYRDWALVRDLKDRYWAERRRRLAPQEALEIAAGLRQQVRALRPDWPSAADRRSDLETHVRVAAALRCVRLPSGA